MSCVHKAQGHPYKRMAFSEEREKTTLARFDDAVQHNEHPPASKLDYENAVGATRGTSVRVATVFEFSGLRFNAKCRM